MNDEKKETKKADGVFYIEHNCGCVFTISAETFLASFESIDPERVSLHCPNCFAVVPRGPLFSLLDTLERYQKTAQYMEKAGFKIKKAPERKIVIDLENEKED